MADYNVLGARSRKAGADAVIELQENGGTTWTFGANNSGSSFIFKRGATTIWTLTASGVTQATGVFSQDDTTDTTSTVTGSIHTDGGVGIAKALWVGTTSRLVGAVTLDAALIGDLDTDTSSATTGAFQTDGGMGIAKALWVGTTSRLVGAVTTDVGVSVGTTLTLADGGVVTQQSTTTTAVTLNTNSGQITTFAGSLAAAGEESFTVNNSVVAVTDVPVVSIVSTGNGTASASVTAIGSGTFEITVTNLHASEAFNALHVISFAVIKGSAS